jgi:hypothetical protein
MVWKGSPGDEEKIGDGLEKRRQKKTKLGCSLKLNGSTMLSR